MLFKICLFFVLIQLLYISVDGAEDGDNGYLLSEEEERNKITGLSVPLPDEEAAKTNENLASIPKIKGQKTKTNETGKIKEDNKSKVIKTKKSKSHKHDDTDSKIKHSLSKQNSNKTQENKPKESDIKATSQSDVADNKNSIKPVGVVDSKVKPSSDDKVQEKSKEKEEDLKTKSETVTDGNVKGQSKDNSTELSKKKDNITSTNDKLNSEDKDSTTKKGTTQDIDSSKKSKDDKDGKTKSDSSTDSNNVRKTTIRTEDVKAKTEPKMEDETTKKIDQSNKGDKDEKDTKHEATKVPSNVSTKRDSEQERENMGSNELIEEVKNIKDSIPTDKSMTKHIGDSESDQPGIIDSPPKENGNEIRRSQMSNRRYVGGKSRSDGTSNHFVAFLFFALLFAIIGYVAFQKRKKILGFLIEGRRSTRTRRPSATKDTKVAYKPLESEDKEAGVTDFKYVY